MDEKKRKEIIKEWFKNGGHDKEYDALKIESLIDLAEAATAEAIFKEMDELINSPDNLGIIDNLMVEYEVLKKKFLGGGEAKKR